MRERERERYFVSEIGKMKGGAGRWVGLGVMGLGFLIKKIL